MNIIPEKPIIELLGAMTYLKRYEELLRTPIRRHLFQKDVQLPAEIFDDKSRHSLLVGSSCLDDWRC
jgi:hypothetical protein